ncbi:hypothetical protein Ancab_034117 [Ancistrocladus abbreviatus]
MEDSGGDGGGNCYPWSMNISLNSSSWYDNECHWLDNITQGGEESNSLKLASDQSLSVIDRGICLSPLEAVSLLNDELKLPANVESRSLNSLFDSDLGRGKFHDDLVTLKKGLSLENVNMLEDKSGTGKRVYRAILVYRVGMSEVPFTQGPIHSLEFQAYGTHSKRGVLATDVNQVMVREACEKFQRREKILATLGGKKKLRKVKKKTLELIEEDPISASEGIDLSMASTMDSQIANVNKRVAVMRGERKVEKIWDFLTPVGHHK